MSEPDYSTNQIMCELSTLLARPKHSHKLEDVRLAPKTEVERADLLKQAARLIARVRAFDEGTPS